MRLRSVVAVLAVLGLCSTVMPAQSRDREVPARTVLKLSMDNLITSSDSKVGDPFTATVFEDVRIGEDVVIPKGTKVLGRVTSVTPAQRPNKSGTIAVDFERLSFSANRSIAIEGQLTSLDAAERRQIDEEGRLEGDSTTRRTVIFVGGGAAGGAAIGAIAGGGKGAGIGAAIGAGAGILGTLLQKGEEAQVVKGQKFGMELLRPIRVPASYLASTGRSDSRYEDSDPRDDRDNERRDDRADYRDDRRDGDRFEQRDSRPERRDRPMANLKSVDMIKRAQSELMRQNYYRGVVNGTMTLTTKSALRAYQRDHNLEQTGELDADTAYSLGLVDDYGIEIVPMRLISADAIKQRDGSIDVRIDAQARTGGWDVYADTKTQGDTFKVFVRGIPPAGMATQALTNYPLHVTTRDGRGISKVEVIGDGQPIVIELSAFGIARQTLLKLQQQSSILLVDYREALGVVRRGSSQLADASRLTEQESRLLFALDGLYNATSFAQQMVNAKASEEAMRGAISTLVRLERQSSRLMRSAGERYGRQWSEISSLIQTLADAYQIDTNERD